MRPTPGARSRSWCQLPTALGCPAALETPPRAVQLPGLVASSLVKQTTLWRPSRFARLSAVPPGLGLWLLKQQQLSFRATFLAILLCFPAWLWCQAGASLSSPATAPCPLDLACDSGIPGRFSDPPEGYLESTPAVSSTGIAGGALACPNTCRSTQGCAFWMFHRDSGHGTGTCKMWGSHQNPCLPMSPKDPSSTFFTPADAAESQSLDAAVGGYCKPGVEVSKKESDTGSSTSLEPTRGECPKLRCHSPHTGFLYDHVGRGHLFRVLTGKQGDPFLCFQQCRETPKCAFWMYDLESPLGDCTLWSAAQNPCAPEPGSDDPSTAHFDAHPRHGSFVVGGYCKLPKTGHDEDFVD